MTLLGYMMTLLGSVDYFMIVSTSNRLVNPFLFPVTGIELCFVPFYLAAW
jgi:hypothetical protein